MPNKVRSNSFERGKEDGLAGLSIREGSPEYLEGWNEGYRLNKQQKRQKDACPYCGREIQDD